MTPSLSQSGWMLLAAHPDDDVIGGSGLLLSGEARAVAQLTDGVPADRRWWPETAPVEEHGYRQQRRRESEAALAVAGLAPSALHSLGGRDLRASEEVPRLVGLLVGLLDALRPPRLFTHPYEGGHPDHDAAALVGRAATSLAADPPELWEMTSYHLGPEGVLVSGRFLFPEPAEELHALSPTEQEAKHRMLAAHASQARMLEQFSVEVERRRPAPRYDFTRAPHAGALLYERQGWGDGAVWRSTATRALRQLGLREDGCR